MYYSGVVALKMKLLRLLICALSLALLSPVDARVLRGSSSAHVGVPQTVQNAGSSSLAFLNLVHGIALNSTQAAFPGSLTADGYPTGTISGTWSNNSLPFIPTYFGHYLTWWVATNGFVQLSPGAIIYNGGAAVLGLGGANSGSVGFNFNLGNGVGHQPTSAAPIEFALGALVNGISDAGSCAGGTGGLVCLTANLTTGFNSYGTGTVFQINNVTNLSPGPWTATKLDAQHIQLQGSTYNGTMAVVGGAVGVQSEAIASVSSATYIFSAGTYTAWGGWVLIRQTDLAAYNAGHHANPDYVAAFKAPNLNPRWVRFMDFSSVQGNFSTSFTYRPKVSHLSWGGNYNVDYWGGALTNGGSDNYTLATNPPASPSSGAPVDGEIVSGQISGANTGYNPTLAITGRTGTFPIFNGALTELSLTMTGSVPPVGSVITWAFTGGGLASPHNYTYTTISSDTTLNAICLHITGGGAGSIGLDTTLTNANIITANNEIGTTCGSGGTGTTFKYNPNINSSGVAALGNGLTIVGSDNGGAGTVYNVGFLNPGNLVNADYVTLTFSALAQGWVETAVVANIAGISGGPPLEFYEDFCNQANVGMWYNIPVLYPDAAITSAVTHIASSGVKELVLEMSNETWNTGGGGQWHIFDNLGVRLGLKTNFTGGPAADAYTGLRIIQMAAAARTAWAAAGRSQSQLFISDAYHFVSLDQAQRLNGGALTPASNVTLANYGGSPSNGTTTPSPVPTDPSTSQPFNYSAFPNRPVDWSEFISPAPYFTGVQFNTSFGSALRGGSGINLASYNCSLVASYNYVNGNSTEQQAALDFMFNGTTGDFYTLTGLGTAGLQNNFDLQTWAHGSGTAAADYFGLPTVLSGYDAVRTGTNPHTGLPWVLLGAAGYEGDAQAGPISSGDITIVASTGSGSGHTNLTTLGDVSGYTSGLVGSFCGMSITTFGTPPTSTAATDASNMAVLLNGNGTTLGGFKNDNRYKLLYLQYFNDFEASVTSQGNRLAVPATYGLEGGGTWAKYPGSVYTTPYQSWNAIQSINN